MKIYRNHRPTDPNLPCALTIGNFDGVHRGHQAMLSLLCNEARHRGLPSCVLTFEPHPRDFFALENNRPQDAPARISTLRDKLAELENCGIDEVVVTRFNRAFANLDPLSFVQQIIQKQLNAHYILVGDDFSFGAKRTGNYGMLDSYGDIYGFDVARMMSYEVHGLRVSSSALRKALAAGDMKMAATLQGRPYMISGHICHGRKLGRTLGESQLGLHDGFRTLNIAFPHSQPALKGILIARVHGLTPEPLKAIANLGTRPAVEKNGHVLLEVHCLEWPLATEAAYGKLVQVELIHKLHDERPYPNLEELTLGIAQDVAEAKTWWTINTPHNATT